MKNEDENDKGFRSFFIAAVLAFAATVKVFPDPYFHKDKVTGLEWLKREIIELLEGERA